MVRDRDLGAAIGIAERGRDPHLALHGSVCGLELDHLDDLLVGNKLREVSVIRIRIRARLPGSGGRVVCQRDAEPAAFAGIEREHLAGHAVRYPPGRDRARVEKRAVDRRASPH
jgi:hypothetical protein